MTERERAKRDRDNAGKRRRRRLVVCHLGVSLAANLRIVENAPVWCGIERGSGVKVAFARGLANCPQCLAAFEKSASAGRPNASHAWKSILGPA